MEVIVKTYVYLKAAERGGAGMEEENGEAAGIGFGERILEITLDRAVKVLVPAISADLQAEAISLSFDFGGNRDKGGTNRSRKP